MNRISNRTALGLAALAMLAIVVLVGLGSLLTGPAQPSVAPTGSATAGPSGSPLPPPTGGPGQTPAGSAEPSASSAASPSPVPTRIVLPPPATSGPGPSIEVPPPIR